MLKYELHAALLQKGKARLGIINFFQTGCLPTLAMFQHQSFHLSMTTSQFIAVPTRLLDYRKIHTPCAYMFFLTLWLHPQKLVIAIYRACARTVD